MLDAAGVIQGALVGTIPDDPQRFFQNTGEPARIIGGALEEGLVVALAQGLHPLLQASALDRILAGCPNGGAGHGYVLICLSMWVT
ncbi:hypothetical protein D3C84_990920 [compost metagenome]